MEYDHELKVWPDYFWAISDGRKNFEVRRDDRGFQTGQILWLRKYDPKDTNFVTNGYDGNSEFARITYILTGGQFGIEPGYVVMGLHLLSDNET